jgi:wobble nucleotide-excising tRNase
MEKMKNKEFIRDDGKFRNCVPNIAKASVLNSFISFIDKYTHLKTIIQIF